MPIKKNGTVDTRKERRLNRREQRQKLILEIDDAMKSEEVDEDEELAKEQKPKKKVRKIDKSRIFVLDTNVLLSCPDVIYDPTDPDWKKPLNFDPNLDNAHLVIPSVVHDELEGIKKGNDWRARTARVVLRRLAKLMPLYNGSLQTSLDLSSPIKTGLEDQLLSVLAIHKDFQNVLPVRITDNDGWVAVTALVASLIHKGKKVDGTEPFDLNLVKSRDSYVALLTKDNGLIVKACARLGVFAYECTFDNYPTFTGCRELFVPKEMFIHYFRDETLSEEDFLSYMPEQLPLVANEYVILKLEKEEDYPKGFRATEGYFKNVLRFDGNSRTLRPIKYWRREGSYPPNNGIATYYDALNDETIETIIATGDGGVGKTYTPLIHAINKVDNGEYQRIVIITTLSSKLDCGAIPGKLEDKLDPLVSSCKDVIRSYLESTTRFKEMRKNLRKRNKSEFEYEEPVTKGRKRKSDVGKDKEQASFREERGTYEDAINREVDAIFKRCFEIAPYETIQGRNFNDSIVFLDELQRVSLKNDNDSLNNIVTMLTRSARNSKMIITGDYSQIPRNNPEKMMLNGLNFATRLLKGSDTTAFIHLKDNLRNHTTSLVFENLARVKEELGLY